MLPFLNQCAIPVFDGLLPEPHNQAVLELLFVMAHWHGLAKLRMHHDYTLEILDQVTTALGEKMRAFSDQTCTAFATKELRREFDARVRQQPENLSASEGTASNNTRRKNNTRLPRGFNLNTYKFHSLGDYVTTIREYGTTDSYSTEPVCDTFSPLSFCSPIPYYLQGELEHRSPKSRYRRTSRKGFVKQLTEIERREARLRSIRARNQNAGKPPSEEVAATPDMHHAIGISQNLSENIPHFLQRHAGDPSIKVKHCLYVGSSLCLSFDQNFVPKLKEHILPRIRDILRKEAISDSSCHLPQPGLVPASVPGANLQEHDSVFFKNDRMYYHNIARFNYTTYDVRRAQDVINPGTSHCDIVLLAKTGDTDASSDSDHPFLYGRVLGIYHVNVIYTGEGMLDYDARRVDFLWVRWFNYNESQSIKWDALKLDSVSFPPMATEGAFGFVDPRDVLRSCHIIPAFARGKIHTDGVGLSRIAKDTRDWRGYYINRYVGTLDPN